MTDTFYAGRLLSIQDTVAGSEVTQDYAIGATVLSVYDTSEFSDEGGFLRILHNLPAAVPPDPTEVLYEYTYSTKDDEAGTITLASPLTAAIDQDDEVYVYPYAQEKEALVRLDDEEDGVLARIPHVLVGLLEALVREGTDQESVSLKMEGEDWVVHDVIGGKYLVDGNAVGEPDPDEDPGGGGDGDPPPFSPLPTVTGGIRSLFVTWEPIENGADHILYEVYIDEDAPTDISIIPANLYDDTHGQIMLIESMPNGDPLVAGVDYAVRIVARDSDGPAAPSGEGVGQIIELIPEDVWQDHEDQLEQLQVDLRQLETLGDNIILNGEFDNPATIGDPLSIWGTNNSAVMSRVLTGTANYAIQVVSGANTIGEIIQNGAEGKIPAKPGDVFYTMTGVGTAGGVQNFRIFANYYGATDNYMGTVSSALIPSQAGSLAGAEAATQTANLTLPGTAGITYVRFGIVFTNANTTYHVARFRVAGAITETRIMDNAISTNKIAANQVVTNHIIVGTLQGDRITINTMDAGRIVAGSIYTNLMTANTINGDRITTNTLHANAITTGTLLAGHITATSFDGYEIVGSIIKSASSGNRWEIGAVNVPGEGTVRNYLACFAQVVNTGSFPSHRAGGIALTYETNMDGTGDPGTIMQFASPNWDGTHTERPMMSFHFRRSSGGVRNGRVQFTPRVYMPYLSGVNSIGVSAQGLLQNGSSERIKENFENFELDVDTILGPDPLTFQYKDREAWGDNRVAGYTAERMHEAGLGIFVTRNDKDQITDFQYAQFAATAHQIVLRRHRDMINELRTEVQDLRTELASLK